MIINLDGNDYRRDKGGVWGVAVDDDSDNDYEVSPSLSAALDETERLRAELDAANTRFAKMNTPTGREIELQCDNQRLRAIVDRFNPEADGETIDARDAAWNLYRGAVSRSRAVEIWPWLAEYEAAEKARAQ